MEVHLVDGTYELFRHFYAMPSARDAQGRDVAAVRGVVGSVLGMISAGATHVAVATDHVIESFRNRLWGGYKTGAGIDPDLYAQFPLLEEALAASGIVVWPMVEFEADDALAAAAAQPARSAGRSGDHLHAGQGSVAVRPWHARRAAQSAHANDSRRGGRDRQVRRVAGVHSRLSRAGRRRGRRVSGPPGWGAKSTAAVLARFGHLESIPPDWRDWHVNATNASALALLAREREHVLFRTLATLRTDIELFESIDELQWKGSIASDKIVV